MGVPSFHHSFDFCPASTTALFVISAFTSRETNEVCRKVSDFVALRLYTKLLLPSMVSVGTFFFPSPRNQRVDHRFRFHKWESSQLAQFFPQLRRVCRVKQCAGTYSCKPLYLVANFFRFLLFPLFYSFSMGQIIFVSVSSIVFVIVNVVTTACV